MRVTALVAARNEEGRVGETVEALRSIELLSEVAVVDGGSTDGTVAEAAAAGARVVAARARMGKGDALEGALVHVPAADVYLLADADLGSSAASLGALLEPVVTGRADMAVAVLPDPPTGGFGLVKGAARRAVHRVAGHEPREPLSGQRALTAGCLRACRPLASGFGLEVGLWMDAIRMGFEVAEIPVALEHRFTRKDIAGFRHRGRQGWDAARATIPRALGMR
ncbi:MAG: glycosyltransferase [Actinomycetota bacterium]